MRFCQLRSPRDRPHTSAGGMAPAGRPRIRSSGEVASSKSLWCRNEQALNQVQATHVERYAIYWLPHWRGGKFTHLP